MCLYKYKNLYWEVVYQDFEGEGEGEGEGNT